MKALLALSDFLFTAGLVLAITGGWMIHEGLGLLVGGIIFCLLGVMLFLRSGHVKSTD